MNPRHMGDLIPRPYPPPPCIHTNMMLLTREQLEMSTEHKERSRSKKTDGVGRNLKSSQTSDVRYLSDSSPSVPPVGALFCRVDLTVELLFKDQRSIQLRQRFG
ncbi:unnamed protein product [Arctogadus glacialis]